MPEYGYFLSSEELSGSRIVACAQQGEAAGFRSVLVSDHFHPWLDAQGESPFVWSVLGGIAATTSQRITTGVTCPIMRIHPAVLAQAAATMAEMSGGRFRFGVGSGENLNEHVVGRGWPPAQLRLEMLEEAIEVIRSMWSGNLVTHRGAHFCVENARLYTLPAVPPAILVSGFGEDATDLAARVADGFVNTNPDRDLVDRYRQGGGRGPTVGAVKVCFGEDEGVARKLAHERWRSSGLPGQLNQELALPAHFEQGAALVTEDVTAESIVCGPDPARHAEAIGAYVDAGYDEIFVAQVGGDQEGFLQFFQECVRPLLS